MSTNKRKRLAPAEQQDTHVLRQLANLSYDTAAIDTLVEHYGSTPGECDSTSARALHCCPRSYEESYLREPVGVERACGRDLECEGLCLQGTDGFVLREFMYPGEAPKDGRTLCLLCRRFEVSRAYYKYETGSAAATRSLRISDHYNLVDIPGEYDVRDCIVSGSKYTGLPLPVVLHARTAYTCHTKDGVRHLSQSRMRCPGTEPPTEIGPFLMRRAALGKQVARSEKCPRAKSSSSMDRVQPGVHGQ